MTDKQVKNPVRRGWLLAALLLVVAAVVSSCETDAYEKGEGDLSLMTAELVDASVNSAKNVDYVVTDRGERLTIVSPLTATWISRGDTAYRALLYYNKVGDGRAQPVSFGRVGVVTPHVADSIEGGMKTDPVHLESVWLSPNRRYLNLRLRLLTGHTDDDSAVQSIGMAAEGGLQGEVQQHLRLVLYHHQGGQPEYYSTTTFVSMPLAAVSADTLSLSVNTYGSGVVTHTFALH